MTGLCNTNVANDETKWQWEACDKACSIRRPLVRRPGRGRRHLRLLSAHALHYQLQDYSELFGVVTNATASGAATIQCTKVGCDITEFAYLFYDFLATSSSTPVRSA